MDEERGETILVRGMTPDGLGHDSEGKFYVEQEFHKVDLKEGKVEKNCYPELTSGTDSGRMLLVGPRVHVVGMTEKGKDDDDECAFFLDLEDKKWNHLPLPPLPSKSLVEYDSLDGKIYHYTVALDRSSSAFFHADGLDYFELIWFPVSRLKPNQRFAYGLNADTANKRLLLNLRPGGELYGYYPANGELDLVGKQVDHWSDIVVVADNVAFVHDDNGFTGCDVIYAYDLSNFGKKLEVVWDGQEMDDVYSTAYQFQGLFHVPNTSNFWLAGSCPHRGNNTMQLLLVKFQARRTDDDRIICTPLALFYPILDFTLQVFDFLLLPSPSQGHDNVVAKDSLEKEGKEEEGEGSDSMLKGQ